MAQITSHTQASLDRAKSDIDDRVRSILDEGVEAGVSGDDMYSAGGSQFMSEPQGPSPMSEFEPDESTQQGVDPAIFEELMALEDDDPLATGEATPTGEDFANDLTSMTTRDDDELLNTLATDNNIGVDSWGTWYKNMSLGRNTGGNGLPAAAVMAANSYSPLTGYLMTQNPYMKPWLPEQMIASIQQSYEGLNMSDEEKEQYKNFSFDERAAYVQRKQWDLANKAYEGTFNRPGVQMSGAITGVLADPVTLFLPMGGTYKAAAGIGAATMASEQVLHNVIDPEKNTFDDVLKMATFGVGLGLAAKGVADGAMALADKYIARGKPLDQNFIDEADIGHTADPVGYQYKEGITYTDDVLQNANDRLGLGSTEKYIDDLTWSANPDTKSNFLINDMAEDSLGDYANRGIVEMNMEMDLILDKGTKAQIKKAAEVNAMHEKRVMEDAAYASQITDRSSPKTVAEAMLKDAQMRRDFDAIDIQRQMEVSAEIKAPNPNTAMAEALKAAGRVSTKKTEDLDNLKSMVPKSQSGQVAAWLLRDLGLSASSGALGYSQSEGNGYVAVASALAGLGGSRMLSKVMAKTTPAVGKTVDTSKLDEAGFNNLADKFVAGKWRKRPGEEFRSWGEGNNHSGAIFAETLREFGERWNGSVAYLVNKSKDALGPLTKGTPEYDQVAQLLRKEINPLNASPKAIKAAKALRQQLDSVVADAKKWGVVTGKQAAEFAAKTAKEGYFPRIYNKALLESSEGKQLWVETLSSYKWSEKELTDTLRLLTKNDAVGKWDIKDFKKKDGFYFVNRQQASEFHSKNSMATYSTRSTHLNKERTLQLPDKVLAPFLENDPANVLSSYFQDTMKAIEGAKMWGADDRMMTAFFNDFKRQGRSKEELDFAMEVYKTTIGDPDSMILRQFMEQNNTVRNIANTASSMEVVGTLLHAPITNLVQGVVNSSIFLSSRAGAKTPLLVLKGMAKGMSKEGFDYTDRIGAALQSTILETSAEMGHGSSKWASTFLKGTGFNFIEKMQRSISSNIGRAYVEDLMETKLRILSSFKAKGLGNAQRQELKGLDAQLREMGIHSDPVTTEGDIAKDIMRAINDIEQVTVETTENAARRTSDAHMSDPGLGSVAKAAQRFSNTTNFVNTPDQMPLYWQSPYAKMSRQFKTFTFHQGAFLVDNLIKPVFKGKRGQLDTQADIAERLAPVLAIAGIGMPLGYGVNELKAFVKQDDKELTGTEQLVRAFGAIGGLGMAMDLAQQGMYDENFLTNFVGGKALGDASRISFGGIGALKALAEGEGTESYKPLAKALTRSAVLPVEGLWADNFNKNPKKKGGKKGGLYGNPYSNPY